MQVDQDALRQGANTLLEVAMGTHRANLVARLRSLPEGKIEIQVKCRTAQVLKIARVS
jgi:hypothetical protein